MHCNRTILESLNLRERNSKLRKLSPVIKNLRFSLTRRSGGFLFPVLRLKNFQLQAETLQLLMHLLTDVTQGFNLNARLFKRALLFSR